MRKKTMHRIWDYLLWGGLTLLPIFAMLLVMFRTGEFTTLSDAFHQIGLGVISDNLFTNSLNQIFGTDGLLPIFSNTAVFDFVAYYIFVSLIHLFADFLLFLPNLARNWVNRVTGGDE